MQVDVITIFPDYLAPLNLSLLGRAQAAGILQVRVHDLRQWTHDVHRTVDDTPYGGGPGMVMRPEPWGEALDAVLPDGGLLVVPSPAGVTFTQAMARELAGQEHLVFACGRYEGIDERVLEHAATRARVLEVSLGDYVLFGGEVAVLVILEAVGRLLPGVLGNADSLVEESYAQGLLEGPVYTKPPVFRGLEVPAVLRSGDHARIARWRRDQSLLRTARRRPDLIAALPPDALSARDREVLAQVADPDGRESASADGAGATA
jgi:tRNA (guanine37-N1)-methyltransferase